MLRAAARDNCTLPATPMQKEEENSGDERMYVTRSMPWTKRGSVATQYSCPLGGSVHTNELFLLLFRAKIRTSTKGKNILDTLCFRSLANLNTEPQDGAMKRDTPAAHHLSSPSPDWCMLNEGSCLFYTTLGSARRARDCVL